MNNEALGPAERIVRAVLEYVDHLAHGRPGIVVPDARTKIGVRWDFATHRMEGENKDQKVAYRLTKQAGKTIPVKVGPVQADGRILDEAGRDAGVFRESGIFPEVATWVYRQIAEVWKLDHEFAARWASYEFRQDHRDLKILLAAFMLVQARKGDPVVENGKIAFYDDDYRDVGEAMMLIYRRDGNDLNPKLLLRIREVLEIPGIAAINRELGFGRSARTPFLGRWGKVVQKWLQNREENPKLLDGLMKAGFCTTVRTLCACTGYKPETERFFQAVRSKQRQSKDGRRSMAIGRELAAAESWEGLTEEEICRRIEKDKPNYKRIVGMVPKAVGLTRAIVSCAIESGAMSAKDLVIATPTIEELGLMEVHAIRIHWEAATRAATDMRAANIAARVRGKETKEKLVEAADAALKKATEAVMKDMRVYVFVDRSGSMEQAIEAAIRLITRMLPAFPLERLHCAHFNTMGQEVTFKAASAAGVAQAFRGVAATGGTDYGAGVQALQHHKPKDDEDVLFIFVGDQQAPHFDGAVRASGLRPMAFGFVYTVGNAGEQAHAVEHTATSLGIPCFRLDDKMFEDTYAAPRTIRALVSATPVGAAAQAHRAAAPRLTLAEEILKTELLVKPAWAEP